MFTETETAVVPAVADHSRALAEALRALLDPENGRDECADRLAGVWDDARAALAAYDAEQPRVLAARVHVLATGAYAVVQGNGWTGDYRLAAGKSAAASLRASADDEAERGARLLRRAARMRAVADHMDRAR